MNNKSWVTLFDLIIIYIVKNFIMFILLSSFMDSNAIIRKVNKNNFELSILKSLWLNFWYIVGTLRYILFWSKLVILRNPSEYVLSSCTLVCIGLLIINTIFLFLIELRLDVLSRQTHISLRSILHKCQTYLTSLYIVQGRLNRIVLQAYNYII